MSTTSKQDNDFLNSVVGSDLLENAIGWITDNMSIDEVFGEKKLLEEANNYDPEGIFSKATLEQWAEDNGYIKE
jgi:hypothetical protein